LEASGNGHPDGICRLIGTNITFPEFPRIESKKSFKQVLQLLVKKRQYPASAR
jgi:hypothetical protein